MELVYLWVEDYKNIKKQGFNFSPRFRCEFKDEYEKYTDVNGKEKLKDDCELIIHKNKDCLSVFPENINITAIVGENGSGKSSLLEIINYIYQLFSRRDNRDNSGYLFEIYLKCKNCIFIIYDGTSFYNIGSIKVKNSEIINFKDINENIKIHSMKYQNGNENIYKQIIEHLRRLDNLKLTFFSPNKIYLDFRGNDKSSDNLENALEEIYEKEFKKIKERFHSLFGKENKFETVAQCLKKIKDDSLAENWGFINDNDIKKLKALVVIKDNEKKVFSNIKDTEQRDIYEVAFDGNVNVDLLLALSEFQILDFYDTTKNGSLEEDLIDSFGMNFNSLSSGEKNILKILIYISENIENIENELTIFLDEPDTTIHPNWQRTLIQDILKTISKDNDKPINFIITSHSPFILSDLPKENVIFLEKGKQVYPFEDNQQTFGANIHTLLSHGFFMKDGLLGEFAKDKIQSIIKYYEEILKAELTKEENKTQRIIEKRKYEKEHKAMFWQIQSIIGDDYLKQVIKNHLIVIEKKLHDDYLIDEEIDKLQKQIDKLKKIKDA